jgi:hypothetical protein
LWDTQDIAVVPSECSSRRDHGKIPVTTRAAAASADFWWS